MVIFFPSTHPSLLSSWRNTSRKSKLLEAVLQSRNPIRRTFVDCSAWADAQSTKSVAKSARPKWLLLITDDRLGPTRIEFLLTRESVPTEVDGPVAFLSSDYPIRSRQHIWRDD